jgi:hypothetical protein
LESKEEQGASSFASKPHIQIVPLRYDTVPRLRAVEFYTNIIHTLVLATIFIFIRSCFRVAELSGGFGSALANNQITFMVLEGVMIISVLFAWPCFTGEKLFGGGWRSAEYTFRTGGV